MALPRDLGNLGDVTGGGNANANFDSGTLFIDSVNNRVGIANTTPDVTLRVTGAMGVSGNTTFTGSITVSTNNANGGGIVFADDGDIVDLNDGFCSMRMSSGVRVYSGNRTGTPRISLQSDGQIIANNNITAYGNASDINLKENIVPLDNALENLSRLTGYSFNYKGDDQKLVGVIAQEVMEVYPELVYTYKNLNDVDSMAVRYSHITAVLIEAVKELKARVEELENKVK